MSKPLGINILIGFLGASLLGSAAVPAYADAPRSGKSVSPAVCGVGDQREPGVQGDVTAGTKPSYNCGVKLVGQLPISGNVQGVGKCAYVRPRGGSVLVVDVSDPARPVIVNSVPVAYASESFRVVVNSERAVMVSGSSVYDIKDCLRPVLMGEIKWPPLSVGISPPIGGGGGYGMLPHDLRVNHAGTKVYASQGLWEVDISNLKDPSSWKVTDFRCDILSQTPGPWQAVHQTARKIGLDLCTDAANPQGANWRMAGSSAQTAMMWPQLSHGPDISGDDKRVIIGDQDHLTASKISGGHTSMHIVDVTQRPAKVLSRVDGPGHAVDWFTTGGREYVLISNEVGTGPTPGSPGSDNPIMKLALANALPSDTCKPYPRPSSLGWAFDAIVMDITDPTKPREASRLKLAINEPENCAQRKLSNQDPTVAYHMIDNPMNANFAMVGFGTAGLRIFDIRNPAKPVEVAYFNHGNPVHSSIGYYDAARGLIYASGAGQFWVLEIEPQVKARLGL